MNFYKNSKVLLNRAEGAVTGEFVNVSYARSLLFAIYHSGVTEGSVSLQYKNPLFDQGPGN